MPQARELMCVNYITTNIIMISLSSCLITESDVHVQQTSLTFIIHNKGKR